MGNQLLYAVCEKPTKFISNEPARDPQISKTPEIDQIVSKGRFYQWLLKLLSATREVTKIVIESTQEPD